MEPWIDGLWGALAKILAPSRGSEPTSIQPSIASDKINAEHADCTSNSQCAATSDDTTDINPERADYPTETSNPECAATRDDSTDAGIPKPASISASDSFATTDSVASPTADLNPEPSDITTSHSPTNEQRSGVEEEPSTQADNLATSLMEHLHIVPPHQHDSLATPPSCSTPGIEVRGQVATPSSSPGIKVIGEVAEGKVVALKACSRELVGVALTLPTLPAAYICVQLVQVCNSLPEGLVTNKQFLGNAHPHVNLGWRGLLKVASCLPSLCCCKLDGKRPRTG